MDETEMSKTYWLLSNFTTQWEKIKCNKNIMLRYNKG